MNLSFILEKKKVTFALGHNEANVGVKETKPTSADRKWKRNLGIGEQMKDLPFGTLISSLLF